MNKIKNPFENPLVRRWSAGFAAVGALALGACSTASANGNNAPKPSETTTSSTPTPGASETKPATTETTPTLSPELQTIASRLTPEKIRKMTPAQKEVALQVTEVDVKSVDPVNPENAYLQVQRVVQEAFYNAGTTVEDYRGWNAHTGGVRFEDAMATEYAEPLSKGMTGGNLDPASLEAYKVIVSRAGILYGLAEDEPTAGIQLPYKIDVTLDPQSKVVNKIMPSDPSGKFAVQFGANFKEASYIENDWKKCQAIEMTPEPRKTFDVSSPLQRVLVINEGGVLKPHQTSNQ